MRALNCWHDCRALMDNDQGKHKHGEAFDGDGEHEMLATVQRTEYNEVSRG